MTQDEEIVQLKKRIDDLEGIIGKNNYNNSTITLLKKIIIKQALDLSFGISTINDLPIIATKIGFYTATPVIRASSISAPNTQGGTYNQTDVQSIVTAVNSIRTALANIGITS